MGYTSIGRNNETISRYSIARNLAKLRRITLNPIRKEYIGFFIIVIDDLEFLRPLGLADILSG